ncbi:MAG: hypothetical protein NT037_13120 [Hyphomicrobiales bacterium]|jgi:hypothetical protein|nr:hypothetical protein [Hyphomicrobiales bacterium]
MPVSGTPLPSRVSALSMVSVVLVLGLAIGLVAASIGAIDMSLPRAEFVDGGALAQPLLAFLLLLPN